MKLAVAFAILLLCAGCTRNSHADPSAIAAAQARSMAGAVAGWPLSEGLAPSAMQAARDRAYAFCFDMKPTDVGCPKEQDRALISFSYAVSIWQLYRRDHTTVEGYAAAHRRNPNAFREARRYCWSTYADHGAGDARMLGPCMLDAVGGDFFGILPVE